MAKLIVTPEMIEKGEVQTGTFGDVQIYILNGQYIMRKTPRRKKSPKK